jgi:DNA-binding transcriptional ArsR family regulator
VGSKAVLGTESEGMEKAREVMRILAHPCRVHALHILNQREASPKELAHEVGISVQKMAYHIRELRKGGFVRLVKTEPRRGSTEHFFRGTRQAMFSEEDWSQVPEPMRAAIVGMELRVTGQLLERSMRSGLFERLSSRHHSLQQARVDEKGWNACMQVLMEAMSSIDRLCEESEARLEEVGEEGIGLAVSMIGFETE